MDKLQTVLRIILGALFVVFGSNGFLHFIPMPEVGPEAGAFMGALASTKVLFPLISLVEVAAGVMLLTNKFVPFALVIVFPILLGATIYHAALDMGGIMAGLACWIMTIVLMVTYRKNYKSLISND